MGPSGIRVLERNPEAPGRARAWLRDRLDECDARCLWDTAQLVISELVTNSVVHGSGAIELGLTRDPHSVTVTVSDRSEQPAVPRAAAKGSTSGRGLAIVDRLAAEWGTTSADGVKTVWGLLVLPGRHLEAPSASR